MSLKPPKKSDLDKQWMRSRHRCEVLIQPEFHLIVTEGTKTEPMYFEAIRQKSISTIVTESNWKYTERATIH